MQQILKIGTSAGGARAKAVVAWNKETGDIRSGQINAGDGYDYWLIKFDGVENNKDKGDKSDDPGYTRIEYAYYQMAVDAGLNMTECQLYKENNRFHFMTKRFDRAHGSKIHMQSLGALAHYDFNEPGTHSYEQLSAIVNRLINNYNSTCDIFRRMAFNVIAMNHDDHVKNFSFLMDRNGDWSLTPAYDITYAYDPYNIWLRAHQLSICEKTTNITLRDLMSAGRTMGIKGSDMSAIIEQVSDSASKWLEYAEKSHVPEITAQEISKKLKMHANTSTP